MKSARCPGRGRVLLAGHRKPPWQATTPRHGLIRKRQGKKKSHGKESANFPSSATEMESELQDLVNRSTSVS